MALFSATYPDLCDYQKCIRHESLHAVIACLYKQPIDQIRIGRRDDAFTCAETARLTVESWETECVIARAAEVGDRIFGNPCCPEDYEGDRDDVNKILKQHGREMAGYNGDQDAFLNNLDCRLAEIFGRSDVKAAYEAIADALRERRAAEEAPKSSDGVVGETGLFGHETEAIADRFLKDRERPATQVLRS